MHIARSKFLWEGRVLLAAHASRITAWRPPRSSSVASTSRPTSPTSSRCAGCSGRRRGEIATRTSQRAGVVLRLPRPRRRGSHARLHPVRSRAGRDLTRTAPAFALELGRGERSSLFMTVACEERAQHASRRRQFLRGRPPRRPPRAAGVDRAGPRRSRPRTGSSTPGSTASLADLYMLTTDTPTRPVSLMPASPGSTPRSAATGSSPR